MKNGKDKPAQRCVAPGEEEAEAEEAYQGPEVLAHQDMAAEARQGQVEVGQVLDEVFHEGEHGEYDESFKSFVAIFYIVVSQMCQSGSTIIQTLPQRQFLFQNKYNYFFLKKSLIFFMPLVLTFFKFLTPLLSPAFFLLSSSSCLRFFSARVSISSSSPTIARFLE